MDRRFSNIKRLLRRMLLPLFLGALFVYGLWPWVTATGRKSTPNTIVFYGFSILDEAVNRHVFPAFQRDWKQKTGENIELVSSFAGSGTITNQIIMGVPAELALLSLELDAHKLATAKVVAPESWRELPHQGVVNRTPFVILTRPGNPKNIRDFSDCARPGVKVIHPDPLTSGGANWAILAEYGAGALGPGGSPEGGKKLLDGIWRNVVGQAASARAARTQFENGFGDVLITYEQELVRDKALGRLKGELVYPRRTILSEHTLVLIERNIQPARRKSVEALANFLWSEAGQRAFVEAGFRSVEERLNAENPSFGKIEEPFLVSDFGGWKRAKKEIIDEIWKKQVMAKLGK